MGLTGSEIAAMNAHDALTKNRDLQSQLTELRDIVGRIEKQINPNVERTKPRLTYNWRQDRFCFQSKSKHNKHLYKHIKEHWMERDHKSATAYWREKRRLLVGEFFHTSINKGD